MIEVLVTTVILAVGLMGIAALQATSSKYVASGLHRSQAAALSLEIIERMRTNVDVARAGSYDFISLPTYITNCTGISANCTALEMRQHDLRIWSARVAAMLPSGEAAISTTPSPPNPSLPSTITVTLRWNERRDPDEFDNVVLVEQTFVFQLFGLNT